MGKYSSNVARPPSKPRNRGVHPVMRGIGCVMMVIVPFISYGSAVLLVNYAARAGWPIPVTWYGPPQIHPLLLRLSGLTPVWNFLRSQNNLTANLVFAFVIAVVIFGLMSVIYGYIYAMFGPSQYGPNDVPPPRVKTRKYTR